METSRYQNGGIKNEERKHITGSTGTNFWTSARKRKVRCKAEAIIKSRQEIRKTCKWKREKKKKS